MGHFMGVSTTHGVRPRLLPGNQMYSWISLGALCPIFRPSVISTIETGRVGPHIQLAKKKKKADNNTFESISCKSFNSTTFATIIAHATPLGYPKLPLYIPRRRAHRFTAIST